MVRESTAAPLLTRVRQRRRIRATGIPAWHALNSPPPSIRADIQHYGCSDFSKDEALLIGATLKEIYEAKLQWQFPDRPSQVRSTYRPTFAKGYGGQPSPDQRAKVLACQP